jgi:hypothetical protein
VRLFDPPNLHVQAESLLRFPLFAHTYSEFSTLLDDDERFRGDIGLWDAPKLPGIDSAAANAVQARMGWGGGEATVGGVGRSTMTVGMAKVRGLPEFLSAFCRMWMPLAKHSWLVSRLRFMRCSRLDPMTARAS